MQQHAREVMSRRIQPKQRDIDLMLDGYRTLRFPAWLVRKNPEYVARRILEALRRNAPPQPKIAT